MVRLGMENGLRAIGEVSQDLADDMGRLIRSGVEITPNNTLSATGRTLCASTLKMISRLS